MKQDLDSGVERGGIIKAEMKRARRHVTNVNLDNLGACNRREGIDGQLGCPCQCRYIKNAVF